MLSVKSFSTSSSSSSVFCPRAGPSLQTQAPRLQLCPKAGIPLQTQEPRLQVLLGMNRCGSFPFLSAPHSLFSIWTNVKRSEKIPGAPTRRWGEWIWLTEPSGLYRNLPQGLNISCIRVFDQIRDPEMPINLHPLIFRNNWMHSLHYVVQHLSWCWYCCKVHLHPRKLKCISIQTFLTMFL